jgi:hypothetical protein
VIDGLRVVVFLNDHLPPHVHVIGGDKMAVFEFSFQSDEIGLRESHGLKGVELNRIKAERRRRIAELRTGWERIHGK